MTSLMTVCLLVLAADGTAVVDAAPSYSKRGVYYFDSAQKCPLAGVGTRGDNACNRVATDDDFTSVTVDQKGKSITIHNTHDYPAEAIIADVTLLGPGSTLKGATTPVAVHLKVSKKHATAEGKVHLHSVTNEKFGYAHLDEYTVTVTGGPAPVEVLNAKIMQQAVADPDLVARLSNALVEVRDNIKPAHVAKWKGGEPIADIDIGLGVSKAAKYVMKAQLVPGQGWDHTPSTRELLDSGNWELRLRALSSLVPRDVVQRDLFLFGVEDVKALAAVKKNGLNKNEVLTFSMKDGKGFVGVGKVLEPVENAPELARSFAEFSFIGAILMSQADQRAVAKP